MGWILRFLGWSAAFAIPCWWIMSPYQRMLGRLAASIISVFGYDIELQEVEVAAPFDLGIFVAMCLATREAPWPRRRRAISLGLPILVGFEILAIVLSLALALLFQFELKAHAAGQRLSGQVIESIPWINAAVVWLVLLRPRELGRGHAAAAPASPPKRAIADQTNQ